jgi:hypothetical protein
VNGLAVLAEDSWNAASLAASFDLVCIANPQAGVLTGRHCGMAGAAAHTVLVNNRRVMGPR